MLTSPSNIHILVIEDDEGIRDALRIILEDEGYAVDTVSRPDQAPQLMRSNLYQLLLTDLYGPDHSSPFAALTDLHDAADPIPIGIVTAWQKASEMEAQELGYSFLVHKPFNTADLLLHVALCLKGTFTPEQLQQKKLVDSLFQVLITHDWELFSTICSEHITFSAGSKGQPVRVIEGRDNFREYLIQRSLGFSGVLFKDINIYPLPYGLVACYKMIWQSETGGYMQYIGKSTFRFTNGQISKVQAQFDEAEACQAPELDGLAHKDILVTGNTPA